MFLVQLYTQVFAQKVPTAKKELRKTKTLLVLSTASFAGATYCTWNAYEAHYQFKLKYMRGYAIDTNRYFKKFRNQLIFSSGFALTGLALEIIAINNFTHYCTLMDNKITIKVAPSRIGICYSLR